jgi:antitoxin component YwqK of YwqJK toxin-antitoxin module
MKQLLKFLGYLILGLLIVIGALVIYFSSGSNKARIPLSIVPDDAMIIFETNNLSETLLKVTHTQYWRSVIESDALANLKEGMVSYETAVNNNKWLKTILKKQKASLSLHHNNQFDYDYLIVADIKKYGNLNLIPKLANIFKISTKENIIDSIVLHTMYIKEMDQTLHLATIDNLLLCSSSFKLLENTVNQKIKLSENEKKKQEESLTAFKSDLFNVYIHINKLQKYLLSKEAPPFFKGLAYSSLSGKFSNTSFSLSGYTSSYDSVSSPFLALKDSKANKRTTESVIPSDLVFYLNFNIDDFDQFYDNFLNQYAQLDHIGFATYTGGIKITESYLGIDFKKDFLSLLSGEIAVAKVKPTSNLHEKDFLTVIKVNDLDKAKENLNGLTRKIKNRTSFKFNKITYKNHEINYLNIRGFFKLFMGGFLYNREKPYYTFIDNFILFSNSSDLLEYSIDNYLIGNTLERNKDFQKFMGNFEDECQLTCYTNMPTLYEYLYIFGNSHEREELRSYRKIIQNTGNVAFQLSPKGKLLKTALYAQTVESPDKDYEIDLSWNTAENLIIDEFEQLTFKVKLNKEYLTHTGKINYYLPDPENTQDSILVYEGVLEDGDLEGIWRSYYYSNHIKSVVTYKNNKANGTGLFYYANADHIIRAEVDFADDIIDGAYKEFYPNGNIKAKIDFQNGVRWGEAIYYFRNGQVKIEGTFKKGKQSGKWRYYSKNGELLKKENW